METYSGTVITIYLKVVVKQLVGISFLLFLILCVLLFFLIKECKSGEQIKVYDKNYNLQYRIHNNKIYDKNYNKIGSIQNGKVYDKNYSLQQRISPEVDMYGIEERIKYYHDLYK